MLRTTQTGNGIKTITKKTATAQFITTSKENPVIGFRFERLDGTRAKIWAVLKDGQESFYGKRPKLPKQMSCRVEELEDGQVRYEPGAFTTQTTEIKYGHATPIRFPYIEEAPKTPVAQEEPKKVEAQEEAPKQDEDKIEKQVQHVLDTKKGTNITESTVREAVKIAQEKGACYFDKKTRRLVAPKCGFIKKVHVPKLVFFFENRNWGMESSTHVWNN